METIDWTIVAVCMIALSVFTLQAVRYMKGVSDFLSAGRSAGRFIQGYAHGMSAVGAISLVASFEMYYSSGFSPMWWPMMFLPIGIFITLSGWVYYRFRETRCMTMAQFFEVRYSKSLRIYAGLIIWLSGIVNFGIFPAVACRFIVHFCGLPETFLFMGYDIPTFAPIMVITLGIAVTYTNLGGQVTVMVTDCVQGVFCGILFLAIGAFLLCTFSWGDISNALEKAPTQRAQKEAVEQVEKAQVAYDKAVASKIGAAVLEEKRIALNKAHKAQGEDEIKNVAEKKSMLNPANTSGADFSVLFFLIILFNNFYGYLSWQGSQAYFSSSLSPHEQKMSAFISTWIAQPRTLFFVLMPVCALAFMTLPQYADQAASAHQVLSTIDNPVIAKQITVPVAMERIFPIGVKGLFCAAILFFLITTQDTYLHSWGSIFIQDVVLPFRKTPVTPKQQIRLLRWSIFGVAAFAFFFSLLFQQKEYVFMFFAITGAIVSGAGAMIVGGLYFNRGTTAGAWVAMTIGWIMAVGRIVIQQIEPLFENVTNRGPILQAMDWLNSINSQYIWFWIMISCLGGYLLVSLLTCRQPFNMQRMLHRGKYDTTKDHVKAKDASKSIWVKIVGITDEFTLKDRILAVVTVVWNLGWFVLFIIGTVAMFTIEISNNTWSRFWQVWCWIHLLVGIPFMWWFARGAIRDIRRLFAHLATAKRDIRDDGRVMDHRSVVDEDVE